MNLGLMHKSAREVFWVTVLCAVGAFALEGLFAYVFYSFKQQLSDQWLQMAFVQNILKSLLGTEIGGQLGIRTMTSIAWAHPLLLTILWAHTITVCTRVPAGEIDRGTADVMLTLPVSRQCIYISESAVWLASGGIVVAAAFAGCMAGHAVLPTEDKPDPANLLAVTLNLFLMYAAVGGVALLVSALSDRRGRAVAAAFGVVVSSFLLNFLAQFWKPAQPISFLGVLHYYRPLIVFRDSIWPVYDMSVLAGTFLLLWIGGGIVFGRRDVCTV